MIVNESNPMPEFTVQFPEKEKLRMQILPNYSPPVIPSHPITWEFLHERGVGNSFLYWLLFSSEFSSSVALAGGSLRKLFNPQEEIQDYDLFIDPTHFTHLSTLCGMMYRLADKYEDKGCAHEFIIKGVKYQVIPFVGCSSALADSFDFTINSQVVKQGRLRTPFWNDIQTGVVVRNLSFTQSSKALLKHFPLQEGTIKFRVRLFQRMLKFLIQGYPMSGAERDRLVRNIVGSNSDGNIPSYIVSEALRTDSSNG